MTAAFTIVLPHRRNAGNDAALAIALSTLMANTVNEFALLIDAAHDAPLYPRVNAMIDAAYTDCVVYWASDTFAAPAWDVPMLAAWDTNTIVTNILVEPGVIGMSAENRHMDFGRRPETFRRAEFEAWAATAEMRSGEGWYCPYMVSRSAFLDMGGLGDTRTIDHHGFTDADIVFFDRWKASGRRVVRARSFAYHLQRYSQVDEQVAEKRG
jgi:hypothetical protein